MLKEAFAPVYYHVWMSYIRLMNFIFGSNIDDHLKIPIIINNRNRLTFLKLLIDALETRGYRNIYIIDNNSSYEPLLAYYLNSPYKIFRLKENIGYLSLWKTNIYKKFIRDYYVYTDSDVVPSYQCPQNFLQTFLSKMKNDKSVVKIGLGLKIDDLPDCFNKRNEVINWEKQYYKNETDDGFYISNIDTTFALYRPFMKGGACRLKMLRAKPPYEALHMPWYNDSENLSDEEKFYIKTSSTSTHWTSNINK